MKSSGSILICDDDEKTTYFLEQILTKKGNFQVEIKNESGRNVFRKMEFYL